MYQFSAYYTWPCCSLNTPDWITDCWTTLYTKPTCQSQAVRFWIAPAEASSVTSLELCLSNAEYSCKISIPHRALYSLAPGGSWGGLLAKQYRGVDHQRENSTEELIISEKTVQRSWLSKRKQYSSWLSVEKKYRGVDYQRENSTAVDYKRENSTDELIIKEKTVQELIISEKTVQRNWLSVRKQYREVDHQREELRNGCKVIKQKRTEQDLRPPLPTPENSNVTTSTTTTINNNNNNNNNNNDDTNNNNINNDNRYSHHRLCTSDWLFCCQLPC